MSNFCEENQWQDAPFCGGPSDQGAPPCDMSEMSARGYCPGEEGHLAEIESLTRSCETDGTCDDSFTDKCTEQGLSFDYETGACTKEAPIENENVTLPEAGVGGVEAIALTASMLLTVGVQILRRVA